MKRLFLWGLVVSVLVAAAALSRNQGMPPGDLQVEVEVEDRNPWTHLRLNNDPGDFQFVVISDRTGGHRPRIFSQAVEQINLLQPEFVLSVGDLIDDQGRHAAVVNGDPNGRPVRVAADGQRMKDVVGRGPHPLVWQSHDGAAACDQA